MPKYLDKTHLELAKMTLTELLEVNGSRPKNMDALNAVLENVIEAQLNPKDGLSILIKIFEKSCKGSDCQLVTRTKDEFTGKFQCKYQLSIDRMELSDMEQLIAKANWFISDPRIKVHVLDMPDGMNCCLTLEVL